MVKDILVYSELIAPRLQHIIDLIINQILGLQYNITSNKIEFQNSNLPKINYSTTDLNSGVYIKCDSLLFQNTICDQNDKTGHLSTWEELPIFFLTDNKSFIPFDIFSASFYLVSRYEEYLPYEADKYGRFPGTLSLAYKSGFYKMPIVNFWIEKFKEKLKSYYSDLQFSTPKFQFQPTIDIDDAFAYKHKGLKRTLGSSVRSLLNGNLADNLQRVKTLLNLMEDPFHKFELIRDIHKNSDRKPIFFILFARYGKFDKNISTSNPKFRDLIKSLAKDYEIGIHPGFDSNSDFNNLNEELNQLSELIGRPITKSRQHYLKIKFPETYQNLLKLNIKEDYSMGFAEFAGFRAGISTPFKFYDLQKEVETGLTIFPFAVMDVMLQQYMKLSYNEAIDLCKNIIENIRKVNGLFISLWHNESFSDTGIWKNWIKVYQSLLENTKSG